MFKSKMVRGLTITSGLSVSVVDALLKSEGLLVQASSEALRCIIEQDILSFAKYWFNLGRPVPTFFFLFDSLRPLNNLSVMRDSSSWV